MPAAENVSRNADSIIDIRRRPTEYSRRPGFRTFAVEERAMSSRTLACLLIFAAALPALARAQAPAPAAPAKPDSPEVKALIDKARKAGGAMWAVEAQFFCESPRANSANDPVIVPTKIFDNVYAIGRSEERRVATARRRR